LKSEKYYKIGIAKDVSKRIRELQTGNPIELALVHTSFFEKAPKFENKLHKYYSDSVISGEWFELPTEKLEELIEILDNKDFIERVPPFDNVVYYPPGTRVYWRRHPGLVHSLEIKPYDYEVGYNIVLDSQSNQNEPEVTNAGYDELVLEKTGIPSTEGYEVEPSDPNSYNLEGKTFFTLDKLLKPNKSNNPADSSPEHT